MKQATQIQSAQPVAAEPGMRQGRELMRAVMPFTEEQRARSWWCLGSTVTLMIGAKIGRAHV